MAETLKAYSRYSYNLPKLHKTLHAARTAHLRERPVARRSSASCPLRSAQRRWVR